VPTLPRWPLPANIHPIDKERTGPDLDDRFLYYLIMRQTGRFLCTKSFVQYKMPPLNR
jgi:hypothetical protein